MALRRRATITAGSAFAPGSVLRVDTGADSGRVKVKKCAGAGPYTLTVRRFRWPDRAWATLRACWRRAKEPFRDWWWDRCEARRCLRAATFETAAWDFYCSRHAPDGAVSIDEGDDGGWPRVGCVGEERT